MKIEQFVAQVHKAIGTGNGDGIARLIHEDAEVWENTDGQTRRFEDVQRFHALLAASLKSMHFEDLRITPTENGYVEQHVKVMTRKNGDVFRSPACMLVSMRGGKISYVEEYLDANSFPPEVSAARQQSDALRTA